MEKIIIFCLICYSMTRILKDSLVFDKPREWILKRENKTINYLIQCATCMGFWVGLFIHFTTFELTTWYGDCLIGSVASSLGSMIEEKFFNT